MVAQPAEKSCGESVQPFLASILEEVMGPVSSGFSEVRALFEKEVDELSQSFRATQDSVQLKEVGEQAGEPSSQQPGVDFHGAFLSPLLSALASDSLSPLLSLTVPSDLFLSLLFPFPFHPFIWYSCHPSIHS